VKCVPAQEAGTFADVQLDGGVYTMFIGYSLQATLEQINRKGLLQGRIEDVRLFGVRDEKDLHVASAMAAPLCERILFNFTSLFFSDSLLLPPRLSFNDPHAATVWHSIFLRF